tara:strand:+ start:253 stop:900 length:648 start_codon:yes stop_codon:yes gene_type:complete
MVVQGFGRPTAQGFVRPAQGPPPSRGFSSQLSSRSSFILPAPAPLGQSRASTPFLRPAAGHSAYAVHPASTMARCGQLSRKSSEQIQSQGQFLPLFAAPWNGRTPVVERQIPAYESSGARLQRERQRLPRLHDRPATVSSEWTLLMSPRSSVVRISRPWPEYQPEASAPIGRRWEGTSLGGLHEHKKPSSRMRAGADKPPPRMRAFPTYPATPRL